MFAHLSVSSHCALLASAASCSRPRVPLGTCLPSSLATPCRWLVKARMVKAHLHRSVRDSHNNHNDAVSDAANNHNNAPVDIREAALEGVRGGLVPGAPQAGVVAEPLPRKLPGIIQELFICVMKNNLPHLSNASAASRT